MSVRVDWRYCTGASPATPGLSPEMRAWLATFIATHRASRRRVVGLASDASDATYRPVQSGWKDPFAT